jgi:hypothetical protein
MMDVPRCHPRPAGSARRGVVAAVILTLVLAAAWPTFTPWENSEAATVEVYYGPEDGPGDRLVALYDRARQYI